VLVSAAAALAVAGCSSATTTAAPAPTATTTTASPTATTTGGTVTVTSAVPAGSVAPKGGAGCPVSEATLLKALRSSAVSKFLAPTDTLTGITCYQGYALGLTHPRQADNAEVVFHYTGGAWHAVNGGTAGYCDGVVPAAVRPHLKHC
jgi:hypothetical protein